MRLAAREARQTGRGSCGRAARAVRRGPIHVGARPGSPSTHGAARRAHRAVYA